MLQARSPFRTLAKNRTISPPPPSRQGRPFPPSRESVISLCALRCRLLHRPVEFGSVDPHAVQNDRELPRDGDLGLAEAVSLDELGSPSLPDHFGTRVRSTPAASNRYMRSMASPHFEIRPDQSISPEAWRRVVNPIYAPTLLDRLKRVGSSIVALKQSAVIGPTPGTVIQRQLTASEHDCIVVAPSLIPAGPVSGSRPIGEMRSTSPNCIELVN
jgi:hypothetical protein